MGLRTTVKNRTFQPATQELVDALELCKSLSSSDPARALQIALDTQEQAERKGFKEIQAQALLFCARAYDRLSQHNATASCLQKAESLLCLSGPLPDRFALYQAWGVHYKNRGELLKAYDYLDRALRLSEANELRGGRSHILNSLGNVFARIGAYDTALRYFFEALDLAEQEDDQLLIAASGANIGSTYYQLGDNCKALQFFLQALAIQTRLNNIVGIARESKNAAIIYRFQKDLPQATEHFERALAIWRKIGNRTKEADILTNIGMVHAESGDLSLGLSLSLEAKRCASDVKDTFEYAFILSNLGWIYTQKKDYEKGLIALFKSLRLFGRLGMRRYENEVRKLLADLYRHRGDYEKSLKYERKYYQVREELQGSEMQRSIADLEMRRTLQKIDEEKDHLRRQAEQARREIEVRVKELNELTVNLTERNEALKRIREDLQPLLRVPEEKTRTNANRIVRQIEEVITEEKRNLFQEQFEGVYQEFIRHLRTICPDLTPAEIRICVLIKLDLSNKQIAEMLFASPLTIKTHRAHIRRKLGLHNGESLTSLLFAI